MERAPIASDVGCKQMTKVWTPLRRVNGLFRWYGNSTFPRGAIGCALRIFISFAYKTVKCKPTTRGIVHLESLSAMEYHCSEPHTSAEIYRYLERIWNAEKLTPKDLRNWRCMSRLLETELSQCLSGERSRIEPGLTTRRRSRQEISPGRAGDFPVCNRSFSSR